jgi:hypothetical protein
MTMSKDTTGEIELVMAYIRPDKLTDVKKALAETGAPSLTVTNVSGRGSQPAKKSQYRGEEYTVDLHEKVKVECVVADIPAEDCFLLKQQHRYEPERQVQTPSEPSIPVCRRISVG